MLTLLGLGTAVPQHAMDQEQALKLTEEIACSSQQQRRLAGVLYRRAGVNSRYTVLPHRIAVKWAKESATELSIADGPGPGPSTARRMELYENFAFPLALHACEQAIAESSIHAEDISHLITVSCTGFAAPGVDISLLSTLNLPAETQRLNVGFMGCHGAINGLRAAHALATLPSTGHVLLCAVELCSLHYRFQWDPDRMLGNALFGDGAAALVCRAARDDDAPLRVAATGSCLIPDSTDAMSWRIGAHGFEMSLTARVPDLIAQHLRPWLAGWLSRQGTSLEEIRTWVVHPGGPRIVSAVEESLQLRPQATALSRSVLADYGNMSSPTVLFILQRLREQQSRDQQPLVPCVILGFGPGLIAEAALLM